MRILALDIGTRRTGVAFGDDANPFVVALQTIHHHSNDELVEAVSVMVKDRKIETLVIGKPLLPDGKKGSQTVKIEKSAKMLEQTLKIPIVWVDERYTSGDGKIASGSDKDARAACSILEMYLNGKV